MQEASIAFMAGRMALQWRRSLACHLHTVLQPWPQRDLQQVTSQLLVQCANKWGLPLPPVPDATPAPSTQVCLAAHCCSACHHFAQLHTCRLLSCTLIESSPSCNQAQHESDMHGLRLRRWSKVCSCLLCMITGFRCSQLYPAVNQDQASCSQQAGCLHLLHAVLDLTVDLDHGCSPTQVCL